jgi:hypothetical protein
VTRRLPGDEIVASWYTDVTNYIFASDTNSGLWILRRTE